MCAPRPLQSFIFLTTSRDRKNTMGESGKPRMNNCMMNGSLVSMISGSKWIGPWTNESKHVQYIPPNKSGVKTQMDKRANLRLTSLVGTWVLPWIFCLHFPRNWCPPLALALPALDMAGCASFQPQQLDKSQHGHGPRSLDGLVHGKYEMEMIEGYPQWLGSPNNQWMDIKMVL